VSDTVDKLGISHGSVDKIVYKECNSEKFTRDGCQENERLNTRKMVWSCAAGYWIDIKRKVREF